MNAEIISVGTEIILGNILNTHAKFLSQELAALGVNMYYQTAVGDNDKRFRQILQNALQRSDVIFLTGGLGPTTDDITKEVACELLGIPCRYDEEILKKIEGYFSRSGKTMTENNKKQALVPEGAKVLQNRWGTAPGFLIMKDQKILVLLPGPPRELEPMFLEEVKPFFQRQGEFVIQSKMVHVFGVGESQLEEQIADLVKSTNPTVALYAKTGEVHIRVTARAKSGQEAVAEIDQMIDRLREVLGDHIYGIDVENMQKAVVNELIAQQKTIATVESCTGGMLAGLLTEIPGVSAVFEMGLVTYSNRVKNKELGVLNGTLSRVGAVSEETAVQMARGLAFKSNADYNVAITGIAGPGGGTEEKPVGTVYIAVERSGKVWCEKHYFARHEGERDYIRMLSCLVALNMVRLTLVDGGKYGVKYEK